MRENLSDSLPSFLAMPGPRFPPEDDFDLDCLLYILWVFIQLQEILRVQFPGPLRDDFPVVNVPATRLKVGIFVFL